MVDHLTLGIDPAGAHTGINALEVAAGLVRRTFRVDGAFRPTISIGIAEIAPDAGARGSLRLRPALGIRAARRREAGVPRGFHRLRRRYCFWDLVALAKGVALVASWTFTHRNMILRVTVGVESAGATARVQAVLLDTRLALGAFVIDDAFRAAVGRCTQKARITAAHGRLAEWLAGSIGPTR